MSKLSQRLAALSPEKRRLVMQRLRQTGPDRERALDEKFEIPPLVPVPRDAPLPLSFGQSRLWFMEQIEGASAHYNEFGGHIIEGRLDAKALHKSLNTIVSRHEILRTTFPEVNGRPVQCIADPAPVPVQIASVEDLAESERMAEIERRAKIEAKHPFDLSIGPLLRVTLIRMKSECHALFVTMHHIVCDNWSAAVFIRELTQLYQSFSVGEASPLEDLPIQYADYACRQQCYLQGNAIEESLRYWKEHLNPYPPLLLLPLDGPRPPRQTFEGDNYYFEIDETLTQRLKALSQTSGVTLFMTVLAAYASMLSRYSGQEDLVVGVPIANRNHRETEGLIGFFVNTLLIRIRLEGDPSFQALLQRVREVTMGAYTNQDIPLDKVVESLTLNRNTERNEWFRAMLIYQNAPAAVWELPGLRFQRLPLDSGSVRSDIDLYVSEVPGCLKGSFRYNAQLFYINTIARMSSRFEFLLERIVDTPHASLDELWFDTAVELPGMASVLEATA